MSEHPGWHKGDLICIPQELCRGGSAVADGCHVFIAEYDPHVENGRWKYACRNCSEIRRATLADVVRLVDIASMEMQRCAERVQRLVDIRDTFFGQEWRGSHDDIS